MFMEAFRGSKWRIEDCVFVCVRKKRDLGVVRRMNVFVRVCG